MGFEFNLGKVKESLMSAGKEVEGMAKGASAVAKIKIDIRNKETFLEKQYALLGKAYYEAHKDEDVEEQAYFPSIKEAEAELARLKEELLTVQGAVVCPVCGEKQTDKHGFCSNCGAQLKVKEEEPEVVAEVSDDEILDVVEDTVEEVVEEEIIEE